MKCSMDFVSCSFFCGVIFGRCGGLSVGEALFYLGFLGAVVSWFEYYLYNQLVKTRTSLFYVTLLLNPDSHQSCIASPLVSTSAGCASVVWTCQL